ncbi:hypothetical protein [Thalassotalea sp. PP2-459]|uniref:hypothetical protein n=1 Tax=Thalassotalea sp. PP2-459 TaxID=1742724 RepID=UPI0009453530|nr:hypothetical protein [Thalassotalea sp. PP2-459]OKY27897.1 hypothetical protein BI291_06725 [Thalassotalea sp. PP2-459]
MAKPNTKGPSRTVDISCAACQCKLFKYRKGGKGALIKCFTERIAQDHTEKLGECPQCHQTFAREALIRGVPALKMIGNKVRFK